MTTYYSKNKEKFRNYYLTNREQIIEHTKQWKKDNPEKVRVYKRERYYKYKNTKRNIKYIRDYYLKIKSRDAGLFVRFNDIKRRCKLLKYKYYAARGIKCLWSSYEEFKNDMYESYIQHVNQYGVKNTSIDRIDVNSHYCKDNCRWATWKEQANNRRNNKKKVKYPCHKCGFENEI